MSPREVPPPFTSSDAETFLVRHRGDWFPVDPPMREKVPFHNRTPSMESHEAPRAFQFFKDLGAKNMIDLMDEDEYEPEPDPEDDDDPEPLAALSTEFGS